MKPQRIQLKRTKGWRMPPNTVKVDRSTKWGNPFIPGEKAKVFLPGLMVADRRHAFVLYKSCAALNEKLVAAARAQNWPVKIWCAGALLRMSLARKMSAMLPFCWKLLILNYFQERLYGNEINNN